MTGKANTRSASRGEAGAADCCGEGGRARGERRSRMGGVVRGVAASQRVELSLDGLSAEGVETAARALRDAEGVVEALLNPITARAVVEFDPRTVGVEWVEDILMARGAETRHRLARWHVPLPDLGCDRCAARIEEDVGRVPGVEGATMNRTAESLAVAYTPAEAPQDRVRAALAAHGFAPQVPPGSRVV